MMDNRTNEFALEWIALESFVNDGSPSGFSHLVGISEEYRPSAPNTFQLTAFFPNPDALVRNGIAPATLAGSLDVAGDVPFIIAHPLCVEEIGQHRSLVGVRRKLVEARATSSVRTVWVLDRGRPSALVKLHLPVTLGRFRRDIRLHTWISSLENSQLLARALEGGRLNVPRGFAYLPETGGSFIESDGNVQGFGHIERSLVSRPAASDPSYIIPFFSLWAAPPRGQTHSQLRRLVEMNAWSFAGVLDLVVRPLVEGYEFLALQVGMLPECNAQNVLLEVNPTTSATRVVHRDLMGFFKDLDFGLVGETDAFGMNRYHTIGRSIGDTRMRRSFAFDFKLGEYVLDPLGREIAGIFNLTVEEVEAAVRDVIEASLRWPPAYFPADGLAYGYPRRSSVGRGAYVPIGKPRYRR